MESNNNFALKSINIFGFKTFTEHVHIDFSEGLNVVLATTEYPVPSGLWDFYDALRWLFGIQMHHGMKILYTDSNAVVEAAVTDGNGEEIIIMRSISKNNAEQIYESTPNALSFLLQNFVSGDDTTIAFGNTKIAATSDKKLAMQAKKMIGITTDDNGKTSKVIVLSQG